jgi:DinB superfamily
MGAKAEALAKQFETKVQEATAVLDKVSEGDWKKVTSAEKWPVCVVAHHIAMGHQGIAGLIKSAASGQHKPSFGSTELDQMNAQHAKDFANVGKAETVALHKTNAATAATMVRGLDDAALARSAEPLKGMSAMTTEQMIKAILIGHIDEHVGSIRKTVSA